MAGTGEPVTGEFSCLWQTLCLFCWNITAQGTPNGPRVGMKSSRITGDILKQKWKKAKTKVELCAAVKASLEPVAG